jgi:hypothetical protein
MNEAHIHLILTHVPVIGTLFGLLILAYALLAKKLEVAPIALGIFVLSGLAAVVVYLTGEAAEEAIEGLPGISEALVEPHEEAAVFALLAAVLLGVVSLGGLFLSRRGLPRRLAGVTLALALLTGGVMTYTANLGGRINHPEIRSGQATVQAGDTGEHQEADED